MNLLGTNHVDLDRTRKRRGIPIRLFPFTEPSLCIPYKTSRFPPSSFTHPSIHADNESTLPAIAELLYIHALPEYHNQTETHTSVSWLTNVPQQVVLSFHDSSSTTSTTTTISITAAS